MGYLCWYTIGTISSSVILDHHHHGKKNQAKIEKIKVHILTVEKKHEPTEKNNDESNYRTIVVVVVIVNNSIKYFKLFYEIHSS